jgi:hypothetical protein
MHKRLTSAAALLCVVMAAAACNSPQSPTADKTVDSKVFVTAYTWYDNTPTGSPVISHPVLHDEAGGTGTYEDPVTVAVGHSKETGEDVLDIPAGTRLYLPDVRRYFIVEDSCGDGPAPENGPCHIGAKEEGGDSLWIDMWIGGQGESASFVRNCTLTVTGVLAAVFDPAKNYVVAPGSGVIHDGKCDSGYGSNVIIE